MVRRCHRLLVWVSLVTVLVCAKMLLDIYVKDTNFHLSDRALNQLNCLARAPKAYSGNNQSRREARIDATRTFTQMKYGPVFILGVVGGNSSVNSTWDHFRIYGMLDKTIYKKEKIRCCLMYRDIDKIVTLQSETISERRFQVPADMWSFHVGCPNVKHAQGRIPVGLAVMLPKDVECTENHVTYVAPYFPVKEPEKIVIGSKLAYGNISAEFIIEWVEAMKYIGVDKIVTYYLRTLNSDAQKVLRHYASEGIVDLYFHEPANEDVYPRVDNFYSRVAQRWNDQSTIVYDSFERESGCRYFAIIDQDEFFIPGKYRTLGLMFDHLEQVHKHPAGFLMRAQYYYLSWGKRTNKSQLILRSHTLREGRTPKFQSAKIFQIPARVALGGTDTHGIVPEKGFNILKNCHYANAVEVLYLNWSETQTTYFHDEPSIFSRYFMPTEQGYIRHFRSTCRRENYIKCMKNTSRVLDTEVSDWAEGFMHKVIKVRQLVLGL